MAQHFLLSSAARTLSLAKVLRMTDAEAFSTFRSIRWAGNGGEPFCPACGSVKVYDISTRQRFKCAGCHKQFSVTSGTIFASRKLTIRDILGAIAIFVNGAKGVSALQMSRDLGVQYKTAFVLAHKLREAMGADIDRAPLRGEVEVDGAYFGGHVKPKNRKEDRVDRRLPQNQSGKRQVAVIMRERHGRAIPYVTSSEAESVGMVVESIAEGSRVFADESSAWDTLDAWFDVGRINHKQRYAKGDIRTNWAESYFSRLRRAEMGTHHHIAGSYFGAYADEMAWRENNRGAANGAQYGMVIGAALRAPVSRTWKGYWQRSGLPKAGLGLLPDQRELQQ